MPIPFQYTGKLRSGGRKSPRSEDKQVIRRQLHKQIVRFMEHPPMEVFGLSTVDDRRQIGPFKFQPIICRNRGVTCQIDVTIASRDSFGPVYVSGDLDNRIKTLFDALCLPNRDQIPPKDKPTEEESLFSVLLESDSLISDFSVRTEPLFTPGDNDNVEVKIIVTVKRPNSLF